MPRRKGGLFLPVDVGFMDDDKILDAGERAAWLYFAMSLFCKRTKSDGIMTEGQIERLGITGWKARLADLTRPLGIDQEPLVTAESGVYRVRAWLNHNDPAALTEERLRKDSERKSARNRDGIGTESGRNRDVEQNRTEKNRTEVRNPVRNESSPPLAADDPMRIEVLQRALETHYRKPYPLDAARRTAELVLVGRSDVKDPVQYVMAAVREDWRRFAPPKPEPAVEPIPPQPKPTDAEYEARAKAAAEAKAALAKARSA